MVAKSSAAGLRKERAWAPSAAPPPKALAGTLAVCLVLGATRWGSYVGVSPFFATDVLLTLSLIDRFVVGRSSSRLIGDRFDTSNKKLLLVAIAYIGIRALVSFHAGDVLIWARDFLPFAYIAVALASMCSIAKSTVEMRARTMGLVWLALVFHAIWVAASAVINLSQFAAERPLFGAGIFNPRPDIDSAILGVTAGLLLRRLFLGIKPRLALPGLGLAAIGATQFSTRAGFISIVLCVLVAYAYAYGGMARRNARRVGLILLAPVAIVAVLAVVPQTTVGQRVLATVSPSQASTAAQLNAAGTANARRKAWNGVIAWTGETVERATFGVGFGPDFLAESRTLAYLEGSDYENVRSPHDYFVGVYARLGLVGLLLISLIVLRALRRAFNRRHEITRDELLVTAALLVVAIVPVASLGVVLEAPFGAVPFWWAVGILFAVEKTAPQPQV